MKIDFIQLGRRYNYTYVLILVKFNLLGKLYTDIYTPAFCKKIVFLNKLFPSIVSRNNLEIPFSFVQSFWYLGFDLKWKLITTNTLNEYSNVLLKFGTQISNLVAKLSMNDVIIGMCSESLEVFMQYKKRGKKCILIQYDSGADELCFNNEFDKYKSWGQNNSYRSEEFYSKVYLEWSISDVIIVNSAWAKKMILKQGADEKKVKVVPPVFTFPERSPNRLSLISKTESKLKIIFVGSTALRKGVQYFLGAYKFMPSDKFEFHVIGDYFGNVSLLKVLYPGIFFHGHLNNKELHDIYLNSDILVFPTLSDGFGSVQLEAMSYGIPVLATPNCGEVVEDGISGFIIRPFSEIDIFNKLMILENDRELLIKMKYNALKRSKNFDLLHISPIFFEAISSNEYIDQP